MHYSDEHREQRKTEHVCSAGNFYLLPRNHVTRLQIDYLGNIVEFSSVGKEAIDCRAIGRLVGKHEAFANLAMTSYESGIVRDWASFLSGPFFDLLYYDCFDIFLKDAVNRFKETSFASALDIHLRESLSGTKDDLLVTGAQHDAMMTI